VDPRSRWTQRAALERRLDAALAYRLTTITGGPGAGKTALLERWSAAVGAVGRRCNPDDADLDHFVRAVLDALRLRVPALPPHLSTVLDAPRGPEAGTDRSARPSVLAGAIAEALQATLRRHLVLVLDDVDRLPVEGEAVSFLEALLYSVPSRLHLVVASHHGPPFAVDRLRQRGELLELGAGDLALRVGEVRDWTRDALGTDDLAVAIAERTAGWPAAVVATLCDLQTVRPAEREAALLELGPIPEIDALVVAAWDALDDADRTLIRLASVVPVLTPELLVALGHDATRLPDLHHRGLLLDPDGAVLDGYRVTATARRALERIGLLETGEVADLADRAAAWAVDAGQPELALRTLLVADRSDGLARLLDLAGEQLASGIAADTVSQAVDRLPPAVATEPRFRRLAGIAAQSRGDWDRAVVLLTEVAAGPAADATVRWRLGLIHQLRGELDEALSSYELGASPAAPAVRGPAAPTAGAVICTALAASVLWLRGERDRCEVLADRALALATELDDDRALAYAHTVQAMLAALDGDRPANDAHYLRALELAERAGDVLQLIRIRSNRASHHLEEGAYTDALAELELAGRLADLTGFTPYAAMSLSNRAEALVRLGRLEEAAVDAGDAVVAWRSLGSRLAVYGLEQVAAVQRLRGDRVGAERSYRQAIADAEAGADLQGLVPALAGLAELLARSSPDEAAVLAGRAVDAGPGMGYVAARLAAARVAVAAGQRLVAQRHLTEARAVASTRRDRPGSAAVAELTAVLEQDRTLAEHAVGLWRDVGDPIGLAGAELTVAELLEDRREAARISTAVADRLAGMGCRELDDRTVGLLVKAGVEVEVPVAVQTLGTFRVLLGGVPLKRDGWQSRKARELVKLLATSRGAPVARSWLIEQLWPDLPAVDQATLHRRLRVMVSTVRAVLDPDKRHGADHLVVTDRDTVALDLVHVELDLDRFHRQVEVAASADRAGRPGEALAAWRRAEAAYVGDFCEEERYAEWAVATREEARAAYTRAAARVATAEHDAGRDDEAIRLWLRLLERDPYDERAHLAVVEILAAAGRTGEARRRYLAYAEHMRDLGLEAMPFPSTGTAPARSSGSA
jgi:ATP/maltotriose-dependent transcriptional regulator MalT/DNA-binding SARP family transcriptional activator